MRAKPWMNQDERTPEEITQQRLRNLQLQEGRLVKERERVRSEISELSRETSR